MSSFRQRAGRNLGLKLTALASAVALWSYVAMQPSVEGAFDAAVQYVNVPPGLEMNPDQVEQITVVLRGPSDFLSEIAQEKLTVKIDFANVYGPGEHTFNITAQNLGLPQQVELVKAVPSQLRLLLEKHVRREVEVQPNFTGTYEPGYAMESYSVDPPQLVIEGPESRMALIDRVTTDPINLSGEIGQKSFRVVAYVPDPYVRFLGDASVRVEVNMRKRDSETAPAVQPDN